MNGIHDMGGLHGFGLVNVDPNEPVFTTEWGSRIFCMVQVIDGLGVWNLDEHRHEIELMQPEDYISHTYYGRWMFAMERILYRRNILSLNEVEQRVAEIAADKREFAPLHSEGRNWPLAEADKIPWGAWRKEVTVEPIFAEGQWVRVRNIHPPGHTRVTGYTRGKSGQVFRVNDQAWVLPDTRAHHQGENLQAVYTVRFEAQVLWGEAHAEPNSYVYIDLSEDHLEPEQEKQQ
ncbi:MULTISPECIES: nitrile hydratase subunit beta [Oceanospirillaceae]|uniref:nitrile hydratase subunit beta n=1 Tax=Oceanospirillaceae TaxID=135620 RepID=UPI0026E14A9F|nr:MULTISPECIES: nitrile hydratase subunit beta [unclassified Oceanobacter]MDO6680674.1 nitrile hydratase subunit beta [Oceanobacter sp. 5_MG-2023]MDP2506968.1 nitrile hydratase subunit beta [Oceanobacter sp. 3_MG-2023]|tara:strand:- start:5542 stop:6240 length:699 start_codon:yes stop_codon:yes gene_type:complete